MIGLLPVYTDHMTDRTLRTRLADGEVVVGSFQTIDSPMVSEIMAAAGLDFVIVDQEHGPLSAREVLTHSMAAQRAGAASVVRVRSNDEAEIQRALDVGADAVEIPQIETAADARAAVSGARFDPLGERGLNPYVRAAGYDGDDAYTDEQNESVAVIVHVEGEEAIRNLDEIMSIEGIDVLFLGPYDLSQSIGVPGQVTDPRVVDMMEDACRRAERHDKIVGTYADDPAMASRWIDAGVQFIALSVDAPLLLRGYGDLVSSFE